MMPTFFSPDGNPEVWAECPAGYFTPDEWQAAHPEPAPLAPTEKELFATLRAARDVRLAEYDTLMAQLARWLRIATTESATTALYAKIAELDTWAEALCALPSADGAPWDGGGENTPWPEQPNVLGTE